MRKRVFSILKIVLTLAISGGCLYFAARNLELNAIRTELAGMQVLPAMIAAGVAVVALSLRAWRWHQVIRREHDFAFSNTYWANAIGYLANNILPARAGEVIRSVVLALSANIRKTLVLATALTERMLDAAVLLLLAWCMLFFTVELPPAFRTIWTIVLPVVLLLVVVAFIAPKMQSFWVRLIHLMPLGVAFKMRLEAFLNGLLDGIRVFHNPFFLMQFLGYTVVIWFIDALMFKSLAAAFGGELTVAQSVIFVAIIGFASSVPSTPGYVGVYQAIAVALLPVFGMKESQAFLSVSFFQVMFLGITAVLGGYGWFVMQRRIGKARLAREIEEAES